MSAGPAPQRTGLLAVVDRGGPSNDRTSGPEEPPPRLISYESLAEVEEGTEEEESPIDQGSVEEGLKPPSGPAAEATDADRVWRGSDFGTGNLEVLNAAAEEALSKGQEDMGDSGRAKHDELEDYYRQMPC